MDIGMPFLRGSWIQLLIMPLVGRLIGTVDNSGRMAVGLIGLVASSWLNGHLTQLALALWFCFMPGRQAVRRSLHRGVKHLVTSA